MRNDSVCYDLYLLNTTTYLLLLLLLLSFYSHSTACVSQHPELEKPLEKPEDFVGVKSYGPRARMLTPELRFVYFPSRRTSDIVIHTQPFNGPFSGTTQVSRYQKGKTNLDFTEARDNEWQ